MLRTIIIMSKLIENFIETIKTQKIKTFNFKTFEQQNYKSRQIHYTNK